MEAISTVSWRGLLLYKEVSSKSYACCVHLAIVDSTYCTPRLKTISMQVTMRFIRLPYLLPLLTAMTVTAAPAAGSTSPDLASEARFDPATFIRNLLYPSRREVLDGYNDYGEYFRYGSYPACGSFCPDSSSTTSSMEPETTSSSSSTEPPSSVISTTLVTTTTGAGQSSSPDTSSDWAHTGSFSMPTSWSISTSPNDLPTTAIVQTLGSKVTETPSASPSPAQDGGHSTTITETDTVTVTVQSIVCIIRTTSPDILLSLLRSDINSRQSLLTLTRLLGCED